MESGLECAWVNHDDFTVLVSGGSRCHWVGMCTVWPSHSKWLEQVEQWICIKVSVKLEHSSAETLQMIQKATAMGNWWLATLSRQRAWLMHNISWTIFWQNIKSPRCLSLHTGHIWCPETSGFSQNKNQWWKERNFRPSTRFRNIWQIS